MASEIKIEAWIHAITVIAQTHGWYVMERPSRSSAPTHICINDGLTLVVFARPSGGKLMAQHEDPYKRWKSVEQANDSVRVVVATPSACDVLYAALSEVSDLGRIKDEHR